MADDNFDIARDFAEATGSDVEMVNDLYRRICLYEYKRRQAAPGLRVSAKAFGVGRRIPIINHYKGKKYQ